MTVEFHNTMAGVWNLVQHAIGESGFVVQQVGIFDKGSTTILADIRAGAAKHDLIISALKPAQAAAGRFSLRSAAEPDVWQFVRSHLERLPVPAAAAAAGGAGAGSGGEGEDAGAAVVAERQDVWIYGRMIALHLQRGWSVPLSAAEFYAGLRARFPQRQGMYFLPEQVAEYDRRGGAAPEGRLDPPADQGPGRLPRRSVWTKLEEVDPQEGLAP
jgi:hypothetical protein